MVRTIHTGMSETIKPKKKNLFKFFKSKEFNEARVKLCVIYILLSYLNGQKEDLDELLKGFNGLFIGALKHAANEAMAAFERYERIYRAHIGSDGIDLGDATIDVSKAIDIQMEQSKFFLQEATKAMYKAIDEQVENRVHDEEQLEKEASEDFEICPDEERKLALEATIKIAKSRLDEIHGDVLKGVEIGFNTAINYINRVYLEA